MINKSGGFVFIDDNGKEWVEYYYFRNIDRIATENKVIVEHLLRLLDVSTTTAAIMKIVDLKEYEKLYNETAKTLNYLNYKIFRISNIINEELR